jgi:hypothetical protein
MDHSLTQELSGDVLRGCCEAECSDRQYAAIARHRAVGKVKPLAKQYTWTWTIGLGSLENVLLHVPETPAVAGTSLETSAVAGKRGQYASEDACMRLLL